MSRVQPQVPAPIDQGQAENRSGHIRAMYAALKRGHRPDPNQWGLLSNKEYGRYLEYRCVLPPYESLRMAVGGL